MRFQRGTGFPLLLKKQKLGKSVPFRETLSARGRMQNGEKVLNLQRNVTKTGISPTILKHLLK